MDGLLSRRTFIGGAATAPALLSAPRRPNIILCMGDDHGWSETGYNKHPYIKTPVLDEMAARGMRFDRFHSAAPVCSPTRGSVMTGRHPNRYGTFGANFSIRPEEITIAHQLRRAGYVCGHFGKWHLGPVKSGSRTNPGRMGFHEWLSHDNFFEISPPLARNGGPVEWFDGESSEVLVREAMRFIGKAKADGKPSLTVVWFGSPHVPYSGTSADINLYRDLKGLAGDQAAVLRNRFAEITALDRSMGRLREYLRKNDLDRNTMLWYCGDNGTPPDARLNMTPRGAKGQVYDGGVRIPGLLEWPEGGVSGKNTSVNAVTSDLLPTICDVLEIAPPERPLDGISLKALLEGRMAERPRPICFWQYEAKRDADNGPYLPEAEQAGTTPYATQDSIPFRNWRHPKARTEDFGGAAAILDNRLKLVEPRSGQQELYDIRQDESESRNLAAAQPEAVKKLDGQLKDWQRSVERSLTGADYS